MDLPSIYKYLGKIIRRMNLDIQWRLIKGRIAMKHLHSIMWNMNITNNVTISFWQHNNLLCRKVKAMKIDFWQRCSSLTKMDSEPFACQTTIGGKPQNNGHYPNCYEYLRGMPEERWPLKICLWDPINLNS